MENAEKLTNAKIIMDDCNVDKAIQEQVCDAINNIGYSKRLKGHSPTTLEGKIVSDVDMCDALGAKTIYKCEKKKLIIILLNLLFIIKVTNKLIRRIKNEYKK